MQLEAQDLDAAIATRFVQLVLNCIHQEYPHSNIFWFNSDEDIKPPREMTPAFFGCLDWHSAVHGHWLLVRLCRYFPEAEFQEIARQAISQSLTLEKIQGEIAHLQRSAFFECPYGFAWLLQLAMELREWDESQARVWLSVLEPLEMGIATNFQRWLQRLEFPDRTGAHFHTAFPLSLAWDWAQSQNNQEFAELIEAKAKRFYLQDCNYPFQIEPLAYDFVSPGLAEADLMRRILEPTDFANWLTNFLPQLLMDKPEQYLHPAQVANPNDYLQSHFRGLNLSRAWMLEGIISRLPANDIRLEPLRSLAVLHRQQGLMDVAQEHYASSHWLGTYVVYLVTARGVDV
jgi:hypothetical protein